MTLLQSVKDRWKEPRSTIAQVFKDNDYGYVFHAGQMFVEFLRACNLPINQLVGKKILDYGCGTGRITRFLALSGSYVVGYDPTPECIKESFEEDKKVLASSYKPKLFSSNLSEIKDKFDIVVCINVLGHLTNEELSQALTNIENLLVEGGECYLWVGKMIDLPIRDIENIRKSMKTNVLVIKGKKINGVISDYVQC